MLLLMTTVCFCKVCEGLVRQPAGKLAVAPLGMRYHHHHHFTFLAGLQGFACTDRIDCLCQASQHVMHTMS